MGRFWAWLTGTAQRAPSEATAPRRAGGMFSTDTDVDLATHSLQGQQRLARARQPEAFFPRLRPIAQQPAIGPDGAPLVGTMDGNDVEDSLKATFASAYGYMSDGIALWYSAQGFIGYQFCAILGQHWLIEKACKMPGEDAVRNGYDITVNDGTDIDVKVLDRIREIDMEMDVDGQLIEYVHKGRMFGIRVALFVVDSKDKDYYEKPFNIDGVLPGSYRGISQIDPYWMVPDLSNNETNVPGSLRFYKPTYWICNGKKYHYTHLCVFKTGEVADVLKPSYYFGGVSIPQKIYERVYAAERTANEAPQLAMTKRLTVIYTDLEKAMADQSSFDERMSWWIQARDNYGVKFNGPDDKLEQYDTTLTDLDNVIMTQYQLCAAIAEVPATKLLGTQPKGFNTTGEYEEASYHETLESLEKNKLSSFLHKHHKLVIKSYIVPEFNIAPFTVTVKWNELDAMTANEQADVNLKKAQADAAIVLTGAIDQYDIRARLIADPDSGYNGMSAAVPEMPDKVEPEPGSKPPANDTEANAA